MQYLTIAHIDGDPTDLLDRYRRSSGLMDGVGEDHGIIMHASAQTPEGLLIVNLWPSKDASQAAADDGRRLAVVRQQAVALAQQRKEHYELERETATVRRRARPAA
jgi:hypothetical protein